MSKTIAILGASGNVGKQCVEYFVTQGDTVLAYGRKTPRFAQKDVTNFALDYQDEEQLTSVFEKADAVLIIVGVEYATAKWQEFWPSFAKRVANVIRKTKTRTVFFDNVYSYGLVEGVMSEDTPYNPVSKKGEIRREVDEVFDSLIAEDLPVFVAKAPDFYGPRALSSFFGKRFHEQLAKGKFEWFGDPTLEHTLGYIPDFPPALHELLHSQNTGVYHLPVSEELMSAEKIKKILEEQTGRTYEYSLLRGRLLWFLGLFTPVLRELREMMYQYEHPLPLRFE